MAKIIYVPLDERNCNYILPMRIASAVGFDTTRPGNEIISRKDKHGDVDALWDWLYKNAPGCDYAILSLDMLIYGGLINSRKHYYDESECIERIERIKRLKEINPAMEIYVFMLIMRTSNADNNSEEPKFWARYGKSIWSFSYLTDKKTRVGLEGDENQELQKLEKAIPAEYLDDYISRRKINLAVNLHALSLVKDGFINELVVPKDDNSEYGYSTKDNEALTTEVMRLGVYGKVMIYPGTDEVASTLTARVINRKSNAMPRVFVYYSSTLGPGVIAKYEDRPIHESVKCQLISAHCLIVDNSADADIVLMVNTPGIKMGESYDQTAFDHGYSNFRNLREFVTRLKYYTEAGKRCVVADIAYCNGADNELMGLLAGENLLDKIFAYGGWNTTANTLGVVILQAAAVHYLRLESVRDNLGLFNTHVYKVIEDWAYEANVMKDIVDELLSRGGIDCYALGEHAEDVAEDIRLRLNKFAKTHLANLCDIDITAMRLPWGRTFDIDFDLNMELLPPA